MLERYYQELLNFFARTARSRDAAAELVQEGYLRVLALQRGGHLVKEPRALLYRTVRNLQIDQFRRRQVHDNGTGTGEPADPESIAGPPAEQPDAALASAQAVQALLATIEALPLRCREAFMLHKFDGLPHAEVAAHMGISRKMVEQHINLALRACRRCKNEMDGLAAIPPVTRKSPRE